MKPEIIKALLKVQGQVRRLGHDSENKFASYNYVSIDQYYEKIRPLLTDAGLVIVPTETEAAISPDGKTYKATFDFHILHSSGEVWESAVHRTVYCPYTGAQSCGSALSYAEKFALRTIFKIPTGEYEEPEVQEVEHTATTHDADANDKQKGGQDEEIDFAYSGAPYRVFNAEYSLVQSFTDIRPWGSLMKAEVKKNPEVYATNADEIDRIMSDVKDDVTLSQKQKDALTNSIKSIEQIWESAK